MPMKTPILRGIFINEKYFSKGSFSISDELGKEVIDLFFQSANSFGKDISEQANFKSGEIFYSSNGIESVSLSVTDSAGQIQFLSAENSPSQLIEIKDQSTVVQFHDFLQDNFPLDVSQKKRRKAQSIRTPRSRTSGRPVVNVPNVIGADLKDIKFIDPLLLELRVAHASSPSPKYIAARVQDNQLYVSWNLAPYNVATDSINTVSEEKCVLKLW